MHPRFRPGFSNSAAFGERRMLCRSINDLQSDLDAFDKNELPPVNTKEEMDAYCAKELRDAKLLIDKALGAWTERGRRKGLDRAITSIAAQRMEKRREEFLRSGNLTVRKLEESNRKNSLRNEIVGEKVSILKAELEALNRRMEALRNRIQLYGDGRSITARLQKSLEQLEDREKFLQQRFQELEEKFEAGKQTEQIEQTVKLDDDFRLFVVNHVDLRHADAKQIIADMDQALIENARGDSKRLDALIAKIEKRATAFSLSGDDIKYLKAIAKDLRKKKSGKYLAVAGYVGILDKRLAINDKATIKDRLEAMRDAQIGTKVRIGTTNYVVALFADGAKRIMLRRVDNGTSAVIDTEGESGVYKMVSKNPGGTFAPEVTLNAPAVRDAGTGQLLPAYKDPSIIYLAA